MTIGHHNVDHGMSGHHRREEVNQQWGDWLQQMQPECLSIAEAIYQEFAFTESEERYRAFGFGDTTEAEWHEWLLEDAAAQDLREPMAYAIEHRKDFTELAWIAEKIKADDERKAVSAAAFDNMMKVT